MANNLPLVSIIIPVFNGEKFLSEAIESCLKQTYTCIEIIVINDGSTDKTDFICKNYGDKIKYYKKNNGGISTALNLGIEKSNGKYISWLSHDDFYLKNKILDEINLITKNGSDGIVFSNYHIVNQKSKIIYNINISKKLNLSINPQYLLIYTSSLNGCAMLIPRSLFEKYGFFDISLKYTQDYDKWFQMIDEKFIYNNSYVTCYRVHDNQGTQLFLKNSGELDCLWFKMILWLYDNKNYDKFLGYYESSYFFKYVFKENANMQNTLNFLNDKKFNKNSIDDNVMIRNIRRRVFYFGKSKTFVWTVMDYYKRHGIKKLMIKILKKLI